MSASHDQAQCISKTFVDKSIVCRTHVFPGRSQMSNVKHILNRAQSLGRRPSCRPRSHNTYSTCHVRCTIPYSAWRVKETAKQGRLGPTQVTPSASVATSIISRNTHAIKKPWATFHAPLPLLIPEDDLLPGSLPVFVGANSSCSNIRRTKNFPDRTLSSKCNISPMLTVFLRPLFQQNPSTV